MFKIVWAQSGHQQVYHILYSEIWVPPEPYKASSKNPNEYRFAGDSPNFLLCPEIKGRRRGKPRRGSRLISGSPGPGVTAVCMVCVSAAITRLGLGASGALP